MKIANKTFNYDGITISYSDCGNGYPVILLHGFPQNKSVWLPITKTLAQNFRVIAADTRGQGQSSICNHGQDKKTLAQDVIALMDELKLEKALIVGHDWGGSVAQRIALEYPQRAAGIISTGIPYMPHAKITELCHPKQIFNNWYFFFHQVKSLPEIFIQKAGHEYINWMLDYGSANKQHPVVANNSDIYSTSFCEPARTAAYLNIYRTLFTQDPIDWQPYLANKIDIPAMWIRLEKDPFVPPKMSEGIESFFNQLQLESVPYGHWFPEEAPQEFIRLLMQFAKSINVLAEQEQLICK